MSQKDNSGESMDEVSPLAPSATGVGDKIVKILSEPSDPDEVDWFERTLGEDEEILIWSNPSLITMIPKLFLLLILYISIPLIVALFGGEFGGYLKYSFIIIPIASLFSFADMIVLTNTYYIVTTHEVIKKTGIISTQVRNAMYSNINNVDWTRSVLERLVNGLGLFDIGDITLFTAGTDTSEMYLDNVKDPEVFNSQIKRFVTSYNMAGQKHATTGDVSEEENPPEDNQN